MDAMDANQAIRHAKNEARTEAYREAEAIFSKQLADKDAALADKDAEIARLRAQMGI